MLGGQGAERSSRSSSTGKHNQPCTCQLQRGGAIFSVYPLEGNTSKEKVIYVNETRRTNYPTVLIGPPLFLSRLVTFSEDDAYAVHFLHNDALIIIMHIGNCRVSRILVDNGSSVNILYGSAPDRMDTLEIARAMICPQTKSNLYGFDGNETCSPGTI